MNLYFQALLLFSIGAALYPLLELLYRRRTHWTMALAGGLCFLSICSVNHLLPDAPLWLKCLVCAAAVTVIEFMIGCVVNLKFHLGVWNYSHMPLNLLGQICLPFSVVWFVLSLPAMRLGELLEHLFSGQLLF